MTTRAETNPLILALAEVVRSAVIRQRQLVTWAVEHGVELVEPCDCRTHLDGSGCVCNVEVRVGARWMGKAKASVASGSPPTGPIPRRVCRLCRSGEHDLEPLMGIPVRAPDGSHLGTSWVAVRVRRSKKDDRRRAVLARAGPFGTHAEQLRLAGLS